jgi:hypothetical protein
VNRYIKRQEVGIRKIVSKEMKEVIKEEIKGIGEKNIIERRQLRKKD